MNKLDRQEAESEVDAVTESSGLSLRLIRKLDELYPLAADWDRLAAEGRARSPFKSAAWVITFLEHRVRPDQSWVCVIAERQGELVAVLPLVISGNKTAHSPTDYHTYSIEPVLAEKESPELILEMLAFVAEQIKEINEFEFTRLPESALMLQAAASADSRFRTIKQFDGVGHIIRSVGDYEAYRSEFNSNFRRNLKKSANRIEKLGDISVEFESDRGDNAQLNRFLEIEASGWKSREASAIGSDRDLVAFYTKLIQRLSDQGWFEWEFLKANEETLAANLAIKFQSTLFLVKIGYNEEHARLAPGSRLMELVLQRAFDDPNTAVVDLLTDMEWHANWHPESIKYYNLYFYPSHSNGAYRRRKLGIWLRQQSWLVSLVRATKKMMGREV